MLEGTHSYYVSSGLEGLLGVTTCFSEISPQLATIETMDQIMITDSKHSQKLPKPNK